MVVGLLRVTLHGGIGKRRSRRAGKGFKVSSSPAQLFSPSWVISLHILIPTRCFPTAPPPITGTVFSPSCDAVLLLCLPGGLEDLSACVCLRDVTGR